MKKRIMLISSISLMVILIILALLITKIIPNPFVDTSDLECSRKTPGEEETYVFHFDWLSNIKDAQYINRLFFEDNKDAENYYSEIKDKDIGIELKQNSVVLTSGKDVDNKGNRKKFINIYQDFGFECKQVVK